MAASRIYQTLPQRIQEWNLSPCLAEERNKRELEAVRKQQLQAHAFLQELDRRHVELDGVVARAKALPPLDPDAEEDGDGDNTEGEATLHCITCGHEVTVRSAIRHMDKCFNKYESQTSFGSIYKTRIEGNNMFCDFYSPISNTYCKRLRVLCPEHSKEAKVAEGEVCGCPLVRDVFAETGELCLVARKKCTKHHCWEKLRRAEIDMERVRQWLKLDELLEQERQIRTAMASRAGVLALLLHSTYDHDVMEQQQKQMAEQQKQMAEQQKQIAMQMQQQQQQKQKHRAK